MKPGDLVIVRPSVVGRDPGVEIHRGKTGLVVGFAPEQEKVHPYYRYWEILVESKSMSIQGMNLVVIDETG